MSIVLKGQSSEVQFSQEDWSQLLMMAMRFGWKPVGTERPDIAADWNKDYFSAAGQRVIADDAKSLADSLEQALPSIPDTHIDTPKVSDDGVALTVRPDQWFSGSEQKELIRSFISLAQSGDFTIEPAA